MPLIGNRYLQATDPGAVGAGYQWQNTTTGLLSERNSANTAWVPLYYVDQNNGGLVPVTGAAMTGALTGVTGWAPSDNANFATSLKKGGVDVATLTDLTNQINTLNNSITSKINQALAAITATNSQVATNIAFAKGRNTFTANGQTFQLPTPIFSDGTTATGGQCYWAYGIVFLDGETETAGYTNWKITESGATPPLLTFNCNLAINAVVISYIVLAVR